MSSQTGRLALQDVIEQGWKQLLSKLDRNVPCLTSIEMSPFCVLCSLLFSSLWVFLEKSRARKHQERRFSSRST